MERRRLRAQDQEVDLDRPVNVRFPSVFMPRLERATEKVLGKKVWGRLIMTQSDLIRAGTVRIVKEILEGTAEVSD